MIHNWYILFLLCLGGQLVYVLKRAAFAIRNPHADVHSRWAYVSLNWDVLLLRMIVSQFFYWVGVTHPDFITKIISMFGVSFEMTLPIATSLGAFGFGLASDVLLDWVSEQDKFKWLATQIPQINGKTKDVAAGN